jgi:hypothetical protein
MAKMRSPNYPAVGLSKAVEWTHKLWDKEKKTAVSAFDAALAIGYRGLSGPSRTALAAMKKFGLLDEEKSGLRVSNLALRIIHPAGEEDHLQALREAATKPELFRQLLQSHSQASNDALRSHLITRMNFSETGAKALIEALRDTITIASLDDPEYTVSITPEDGENMETGLQIGRGEVRVAIGSKALKSFSWPLSPETTARLEIVGNEELTSEHIDALTQYLEVAKKLLRTPKN